MKVSKKQAAQNRAAIVKAAERLFRERGFDAASVPEIAKAAGLTHGGFYKNFKSKSALAVEACNQSFARAQRWLAWTRTPEGSLRQYFADYLSPKHRDDSRFGCPMAAFATDIHRQCADVQQAFSTGLDAYLTNLRACIPDEQKRPDEALQQSIAALTMIVGALALSRAIKKTNRKLSDEILRQTRQNLEELFSGGLEAPAEGGKAAPG